MRKLTILYVSVHEILEYDDLRMLTALGHDVLSIGCFSFPGRASPFRPDRPEFRRSSRWSGRA